MSQEKLEQTAKVLRADIINMLTEAGSGHPGGSLSAVEVMTALYFDQMNVDPKNPRDPERDRFVLSKGHVAPVYYAALAERGFFDKKELMTLRKLGSILQGHPDMLLTPGVDASTGSLGQGVSIAVGIALGEKKVRKSNVKVYTLLGDGELDEGQVWEAFMASAHYGLDNLTIIIDNNGLQIDGSNNEVMSLGDLEAKCKAFGLDTVVVKDGNDMGQILDAFNKANTSGKPKCIIAHTVKGKGVSFMENVVGWHGVAPNKEQRDKALAEIGGEVL